MKWKLKWQDLLFHPAAEGEYVSEALLVPDRCRFLHKEQMDACKSYVYWHNIAKEVRTEWLEWRLVAMGALVLWLYWSGAAVKQNRPFQLHLASSIHSEILGKVHTSPKCLLHCRWCQAVTLLHITFIFTPVIRRWGDEEVFPNNIFNGLMKRKAPVQFVSHPDLSPRFLVPGMCRGQSGTPQLRNAVALQRPFQGRGVRVLPRPRRLQWEGRGWGPRHPRRTAAAHIPE